jgi:predicted nucleotidyltransferase
VSPCESEFYRRVLERLREADMRFLVGGAYGLEQVTGVNRRTKDVDVFVHPRERDLVLAVLAEAGIETELTSPIWLAKARAGEHYVDVIFSSGNAIAEVDDAWFAHAEDGVILGVPVKLCPVEEMIWSKAWVMERERYDGADVAHLIRERGDRLDWRRLLDRFGVHSAVLLAHLVLFRFIYPADVSAVPDWVMRELLGHLEDEMASPPSSERVCRGTLLSRYQYRIDIEEWGYRDGRLRPEGRMTAKQADALDREP